MSLSPEQQVSEGHGDQLVRDRGDRQERINHGRGNAEHMIGIAAHTTFNSATFFKWINKAALRE